MAETDPAPDDAPPPAPQPQAGPEPASPPRQRRMPSLPAAPAAVSNGAGFVLALLFWSWVGLPLLRGGPPEVKKVFMAKFLNKDVTGKWLP